MKVAKLKELSVNDDPRPKDRVKWHIIRDLVDKEACHRAWGCALYKLHRIGRIDNDQRDAGDNYARLILDYRKLWCDPIGFGIESPNQQRDYDRRCIETHPTEHALGLAHAESMRKESEFEVRRAQRISRNYKEAREVAGRTNSVLEALLIDEVWPVGERGHLEIAYALTRLHHFFLTGKRTKRENRV